MNIPVHIQSPQLCESINSLWWNQVLVHKGTVATQIVSPFTLNGMIYDFAVAEGRCATSWMATLVKVGWSLSGAPL